MIIWNVGNGSMLAFQNFNQPYTLTVRFKKRGGNNSILIAKKPMNTLTLW